MDCSLLLMLDVDNAPEVDAAPELANKSLAKFGCCDWPGLAKFRMFCAKRDSALAVLDAEDALEAEVPPELANVDNSSSTFCGSKGPESDAFRSVLFPTFGSPASAPSVDELLELADVMELIKDIVRVVFSSAHRLDNERLLGVFTCLLFAPPLFTEDCVALSLSVEDCVCVGNEALLICAIGEATLLTIEDMTVPPS